MQETDIRPADLIAEQSACLEQDRRSLLERPDEFVRVPCPACGATGFVPAFTKADFSYERCVQCETLAMNPRPSRKLMGAFYASSANYRYWADCIFPATDDARRRNLFRPRAHRLADICRRHNLVDATVLEVGAGYGTFCEELHHLPAFGRVLALEPVPELASACNARGLETIASQVEDCDLPDGTVDIVAAFEVIEHLFCPADLVRAAWRLLQPGGLLVLSCPNVKGFDVAALCPASDTIDHEHLNYFHPASLRLLLEREGFAIEEESTPGKLDAELVRKAAMDGRYCLDHQPFLKRVLLEDWDRLGDVFQTFLADNGLSSHMWKVAQKPRNYNAPGTHR